MEKHEAHGGSLEPGDVRVVLFCSSMDHEVLFSVQNLRCSLNSAAVGFCLLQPVEVVEPRPSGP